MAHLLKDFFLVKYLVREKVVVLKMSLTTKITSGILFLLNIIIRTMGDISKIFVGERSEPVLIHEN